MCDRRRSIGGWAKSTSCGSALEEDHQRQQSNWQPIMSAKEAYENDVRTMMPPEPDWDREFAINPNEAHRQQKIYQGLYGALARSQQERAQMAQIHAQEADRRLQKYAVDGFSRFVFDSKIPDKAALEKEMRRRCAERRLRRDLVSKKSPRFMTPGC